MRRLLTPPVVLIAGLSLALAGCSGESPTSPSGSGGGSGTGTCALTIALDATSVNPLAGTAVIVRATVKKNGAAVPDGTSVVITTDFGVFLETGLPSVSKVTSSGFADVTLGATSSGSAHVKAVADCATATLGVDFSSIPADGPYVSSMTPLTGSCLGGDTVTINGGRFLTSLGVQPRVTFGGAQATVVSADASRIVVLTPSRTMADASIPEAVDMVVTVNPGTGAVQTTTPRKFTYTCLGKRIAINAVNPSLGRQDGGEPVAISGANFLPTSSSGPATTRVTFGGVPASITAQTDTTLSVTTPRHTLANASIPETVDVVATVDLGLPTQQSASLLRSFTYYASGAGTPCGSDPRLYITQIVVTTPSASPGSPDGGDVVTISGGGFWYGNTSQPSPMGTLLQVTFGGVPAQVTSWTDSVITVISPRYAAAAADSPTPVDVTVTAGVGTSRQACATLAKGYTYFPGSYQDIFITSISPSTGPNDASTRVTIFGKNFRFPSQVFVSGGSITNAEATVVSISPTQIVFMTPTATGANAGLAGASATVSVRDTYSGKTVNSPVNFRYYACPTTGTAAPATAPWNVSTAVTISGHAFEEPVEAVYTLNGNQFRVNVISVSSSAIVVQMPVLDQLVGTGNISCADAAGSILLTFPGLACAGTIPVPFTYQINRPTITSVSQVTVPQLAGNVVVQVTGSGFVDPMTVEVGTGAATYTVAAIVGSSTSLTFVAPVIADTDFQSQICTPSGGSAPTGHQAIPTRMSVAVVNGRTKCTASLPSALLYTPNNPNCVATLALVGAPVRSTANICTALSGAIGTFNVVGGTAPYALTYTADAGLLPFLSQSLTATSISLSGSGVAPTLAVLDPGATSKTFNYSVKVTDALAGTSTLGPFPFTIMDPYNSPPFQATIPATQTASGGDGPAMSAAGGVSGYVWSVTVPTPPAAGTITVVPTSATTAVIRASSAPATTPGTYTVNVTVHDSLTCLPTHSTTTAVSFTVP